MIFFAPGAPFLDYVLGCIGFFRLPPPPPSELVVFETHIAAAEAGFCGTVHSRYRHITAWWPGLGPAGLARRPWQRVTISRDMRWHKTSEGNLVAILRARQISFGDQAMWIEL